MKKTYYILFIGLFALVLSSFGQAPQAFSYQSVIRDGSGDLVTDQQVGIQISILQGSASGTAVYTETHSPTTNANGLATLNIGEGTPLVGVFGSINWSNGPYFVETSTDPVGGNNYSISSVSQLLSVPYALYAEEAGDDGDWVNDGTGLNTDKNVGIGVETPSVALDVNGEIKANNLETSENLFIRFSDSYVTPNELITEPNGETILPYDFVEQNTNSDVFEWVSDGTIEIKKAGIITLHAGIFYDGAVQYLTVLLNGAYFSSVYGQGLGSGQYNLRNSFSWACDQGDVLQIRARFLGITAVTGITYSNLSVKWTGVL